LDNGPRKATDIILELEKQVKNLAAIISSQDILLKVISNKLSAVLDAAQKPSAPNIVVEAVNTLPNQNMFHQYPQQIDPERQIPISSEASLQEEHSPKGFRRTSRPETYAGDNAFLKQPPKKKEDPSQNQMQFPVQIPRANGKAEVVVPNIATDTKLPSPPQAKQNVKATTGGSVPTQQRITDRNGKSVFLADVEIINLADMESVVKTRTNGTGKWQAALPLGEYKVIIKKFESLTKQKVEVAQTIRVDGTKSPLELEMMIIK
jgi:hypothetical protein